MFVCNHLTMLQINCFYCIQQNTFVSFYKYGNKKTMLLFQPD